MALPEKGTLWRHPAFGSAWRVKSVGPRWVTLAAPYPIHGYARAVRVPVISWPDCNGYAWERTA